MRLIVLPLTLVLGSVLPHLDAEAMANTTRAVIHLIAIHGIHPGLAGDRGALHECRIHAVALATHFDPRRGVRLSIDEGVGRCAGLFLVAGQRLFTGNAVHEIGNVLGLDRLVILIQLLIDKYTVANRWVGDDD